MLVSAFLLMERTVFIMVNKRDERKTTTLSSIQWEIGTVRSLIEREHAKYALKKTPDTYVAYTVLTLLQYHFTKRIRRTPQ